ncbi:MAG: hypothetical protein R6V49_01525, partial [Bacteroidales bacterium]
MFNKTPVILIFCLLLSWTASAQITIGDELVNDYTNPKTYFIGGITVSGASYVDHALVIMLTGLSVGDAIEVPGLQITNAIRRLWGQGLFE